MAQIHVNGKDYQLVTLDELTLDEAMVVWDYTRMSLDQIPDLEGFHPGVVAALIHIAVARGEPQEKPASVRRVVGALPMASLEEVFADISEETEEDEQLPPPSGLGGEPSSTGPSSGSGEDSSSTGVPPPVPSRANGSGSPGSATGATSDPVTSAR